MFTFKATLIVFSAAEERIGKLFESLLSEQLSKRTENDFLISFDENELKIEFYDVELTEKFAPKILGCGTVKKFIIENQAAPKNKPEKEIEAKVKVTENEQVTGLETEAENESEAKKEETESDSEDDTDANAEAGAEETESESKSEKIPEAEDEEEPKPEPEPEATSEAETEKKSNVEVEHESEKEKFSLDYVNEIFEKAKTVTHFYEDLAEYAQIPSELKEDFVKFMLCARNVDKRMPLFPTYGIGTKHTCKVDFYMVNDELPRCTREIDPVKKEVFSKTIEETLGVSIEWFVCDVVNIVISHPSKTVFKRKAEAEEEPEVTPKAKAEEETKPEPEPEEIPEAKTEEETGPESETEVIPEAKVEKKSAEEKSFEEFSKEYAEKLYEESENLEEFSGKLADYIQISDSRIRNAFEELIKAVAETQKMSWFCIENIIKRSSQNLCKRAEFNTNTKVLISKAVKERFNLTLLVFLKLIKELMIEVNAKAKENSEPESEPEVVSEAKAEEELEPESEPEVVSETKSEEEPEAESELEVVSETKSEEELEPESEPEVVSEAKAEEEFEPEPETEVVPEAKAEEEPRPELEAEEISEAKAEEEPEPESEPEETTPEAKAERKPKSESKQEETFDEYWSGIFKCMPKIISTDKYRIENVSKKEQQFLAINKSNPIAFRIKEVLEIMEDISLVADPNFITLSEQIFTKVPVIKVEKSMALYEKMRLLQWSKMLQKFVQRYYTKDPNFRVRIESFLTELREIIMTPEEIAKIK